ncbi:carboxymuconolactone decarboxylase family protein [Glycomyces halotolerans]
MEARLNLHDNEFGQRFYRRFNAAGKVVSDSTLPKEIQELVKIRASQINGCAFCTDMHSKEALAAGETTQRIVLTAAWRDAGVFSDAERAALALTEEGTRIADAGTGVSEETFEAARKHFDEDQMAALIALIAVINTYNRLSVISGLPGGDYQVGQYA